MSAHVFVTEFPAAEASAIAHAVLSRTFTRELIDDAWIVAEFGLKKIEPGPHLATASPGSDAEDEAMRSLLAEAESYAGGGKLAQFIPLPWGTIVLAILKAILAILGG